MTDQQAVERRGGAVGWLDRTFYPGIENFWDDRRFREFILDRIGPEQSVLDLGAGAGIIKEMNFKDRVAHIAGLDPDPRVADNPYLHEAKMGLGESIPWPDENFDTVLADNVLEHLENPVAVFREIARVLKPGGKFLFKTPNRRHYMPTIARVMPHGFHEYYNKLRGREHEDTFRTVYRANRQVDIEAAAKQAGLELTALEFVESRPEYLRMSAVSYVFGIAYERMVNGMPGLRKLRILLVGELTKR